MDLSTIPFLSRVQPLPNNVTNNTVELLVRIMATDIVPMCTPVIIIYDSAVVHSQHLALLYNTYTN